MRGAAALGHHGRQAVRLSVTGRMTCVQPKMPGRVLSEHARPENTPVGSQARCVRTPVDFCVGITQFDGNVSFNFLLEFDSLQCDTHHMSDKRTPGMTGHSEHLERAPAYPQRAGCRQASKRRCRKSQQPSTVPIVPTWTSQLWTSREQHGQWYLRGIATTRDQATPTQNAHAMFFLGLQCRILQAHLHSRIHHNALAVAAKGSVLCAVRSAQCAVRIWHAVKRTDVDSGLPTNDFGCEWCQISDVLEQKGTENTNENVVNTIVQLAM